VPFFVTKDRKYYQAEDLDVQLVVMGGGIGLRALIGGNGEFAATGEPAVLSAHLSGARLQILFTSYYKALLWLYSQVIWNQKGVIKPIHPELCALH